MMRLTWILVAVFALFACALAACEKEEQAEKQVAGAVEKATEEETAEFGKMIEGKLAELDKNITDISGKIENLKEKKAELQGKLGEVQKKRAEVGRKLSELTADKVQQKALKTLLDELLQMYGKLAPLVEVAEGK